MQFFLRKRYKHFQRYRQIANVLLRHGFGYLLHDLGLAEFLPYRKQREVLREADGEVAGATTARRLRLVLEELGPTFIKLGQILSTRTDLLAAEYTEELGKLQDRVPSFPAHEVKECIQMELGRPVSEIFSDFEWEPVAAASIGQVHRAVLPGGREVVVKVRRPGIRETVETDLEILYDLAALVEKRTSWGELYGLTAVVEEFEEMLRNEMDFAREGRNADRFRRNLAGDRDFYVPAVYWEYTSQKILTLEYVPGVKITEVAGRPWSGVDCRELAGRLARNVLKQILIDGFFHGDPHPGNILVRPDGALVYLDFGIMGRLEEGMRERIADLVLGLVRKNTGEVVRAVINLGVVPGHVNMRQLHRDIDRLREKYYETPLSEIGIGESMRDIMRVAYSHRIRVPAEFALMIKTLITTEGIAVRLDPGISIVKIAEPMGYQLLVRRFSPRGVGRLLRESFYDYYHLFSRLPGSLSYLLDLVNRGELRVKAENPDLSRLMGQVNAMLNRLVVSIILASLIVSSSLLVGKKTAFWGIPLAEIGFVAAGVVGLLLVISILRSGRF